MRPSQFEAFAEMVETISPRAIIAALEWEIPILEKILAHTRPVAPSVEAESILEFCRFVAAARRGMTVEFSAATLSSRQRELYRKTVARLVDAEELPFTAKQKFDQLAFNDGRSARLSKFVRVSRSGFHQAENIVTACR
jgi:hypothetical protein